MELYCERACAGCPIHLLKEKSRREAARSDLTRLLAAHDIASIRTVQRDEQELRGNHFTQPSEVIEGWAAAESNAAEQGRQLDVRIVARAAVKIAAGDCAQYQKQVLNRKEV